MTAPEPKTGLVHACAFKVVAHDFIEKEWENKTRIEEEDEPLDKVHKTMPASFTVTTSSDAYNQSFDLSVSLLKF